MVILIPANDNPTHHDIDTFLRCSPSSLYENVIREIECKSGVGALLHPSEEYFLEVAAEAAAQRMTS